MDELEKSLRKLSIKERSKFKVIIGMILSGNISRLDIVKLKGHEGVYRARIGKIRIVFMKRPDGGLMIIKFSRRSDTTYSI